MQPVGHRRVPCSDRSAILDRLDLSDDLDQAGQQEQSGCLSDWWSDH